MFKGVILFFDWPLASIPAISTSSAVKYYRTAAKKIEHPPLILVPTNTYLSFLWSLPTGNTRPARDDLDLPAFTEILALPPLPRYAFTATGFDLWAMLSREPVLAKAWVSFFFYLLCTGASTKGTGGGGMLLSNKLSGILATACIIVELLYASLPTLSRVSRMLNEGNIPNTVARYPASLTTGLLRRSNWSSCLKPFNARS